MIVRRYEAFDYPTYKRWSQRWRVPYSAPDMLPSFGIVANECAMGFLMETEMSLGILCDLVSDPDAERGDVGRAACEVGECLMGRARWRGMKRAMLWTRHPAVERYALKHGMTKLNDLHLFGVEV